MYIKPLKIGNVNLENNILLAPMAGITDLPFRMICKKYGPSLVCTEMVSAKALFYGDEKTKKLLNTKNEKRPIAVQIFGSDIESMVYATKYLQDKADIIDINMGCPAPKVVKNGDGSKLLLDLKLVEKIVKNVVKESKIPVTVKIRKGANAHKAFGLFFILLMQYSVLKRPGNENSRIPHFLYIDEFSDFICGSTEALFTLYRKYRVASVVSVQSLDQLNVEKGKYKRTILANCANKIVFGNNSPEDNEWWQKELGEKREWDWSTSYDTTKGSYDPKLGGIKYKWKPNYMAGKVQSLKFKNCMYKVKNMKGKSIVGTGKLDFLESKYKEPKTVKEYRFDKFTSGIAEEDKIKRPKKKKSTITGFSDDDVGEIDPIQTDTSDSSYFTNNEDAIIFDLKKGNPN